MVIVAVIVGVTALVVAWLVRSEIGRTFFKFRGTRLVSCPETNAATAVTVNAAQAAVTAPFGVPRLRVKDCLRWPDRACCEQACLWQVRAAPRDTLTSTILRQWCEGKPSIYGWIPLERVKRHGRSPGAAGAATSSRARAGDIC
jgi:hypothetical protein